MIFPKDGQKATVENIFNNVKESYYSSGNGNLFHHIWRVDMAIVNAPLVTSKDWSLRKVALCHDIVEDSLATYKDLTDWGLTFEEVCAITLLNRNDDTPKLPYLSYIQKIIDEYHEGTPGADLALDVKMLDLLDHLHPFHVRNVREKKIPLYVGGLSMLIQARRAS